MQNLNIQAAYNFYTSFILNYSREKGEIYRRYGFTLQRSLSSKDWEVFAAILLNDRARPDRGTDLMNHEVKSAIMGNSFEYQYHKSHGIDKLEADKSVDHIFIAHSQSYENVEVWRIERVNLIPIFNKWLPELRENHENQQRQRFRRSVAYGFVTTQGIRILEIQNGQIIVDE